MAVVKKPGADALVYFWFAISLAVLGVVIGQIGAVMMLNGTLELNVLNVTTLHLVAWGCYAGAAIFTIVVMHKALAMLIYLVHHQRPLPPRRMPCRSADDPVPPGKVRHEVLVEAVAQESPAHPGLLHIARGVVLAGKGEQRIVPRRKGCIDDCFTPALLAASMKARCDPSAAALPSGDHEEHFNAVKGLGAGGLVGIVELPHLGLGNSGPSTACAPAALGDPAVGELMGHQ
ncbi:hypothetical protein [Glutamicibacter nicotianae]|uniref:hypothetical protein n=1 Tax=Glutamicibacter nicotianae TaxID=37929 RepID=UPI00167F8540|nr:hypothetical protein [Glutamicibacter nicotianae]